MTRARDLADYISTGVSNTELDVLDGVTAGTVTASKALVVDANKDIASLRNITATGAITVDDITIDGSTISDAGDLTLDSGGNVILDSDGAHVFLRDGGSEYARLTQIGGGLRIQTVGQDADIVFRGNDNGADVDALTLDMSDAGSATFNNLIKVGGTTLTGASLTETGTFTISGGTNVVLDAANEVHLDADSGIIRIQDAGGDIGMLRNESNDFTIRSMVGDANLLFKGNDNGAVITALTLDMSDAGSAVFNNHAYISDNSKLIFGASSDLQIYHDTNHSILKEVGTGALKLIGDDIRLEDASGNNIIKAVGSGSAELYEAGNKKLETTANGINVTGDVVVTRDIYVSDRILHQGDTDTYINFRGDVIDIYTGGTAVVFGSNGIYITDGSLKEDYDALSGTSVTCNVNSGGAFSLTMSGNTTFSFTAPSTGYIEGFVLQLTGNGSTVTWPSSVRWAGGSAPDAPANGETDILVFTSRDGGSNWYGALAVDAAA